MLPLSSKGIYHPIKRKWKSWSKCSSAAHHWPFQTFRVSPAYVFPFCFVQSSHLAFLSRSILLGFQSRDGERAAAGLLHGGATCQCESIQPRYPHWSRELRQRAGDSLLNPFSLISFSPPFPLATWLDSHGQELLPDCYLRVPLGIDWWVSYKKNRFVVLCEEG